ncbi:DUF2529 family protein [Bacillus tianshenii]|nr:DUF2529 family protein [Bacillus tianshenii]
MLRIFTTQLMGIFQNIQEDEELNIEEASRALAQAVVGDGTIYVHGFDEMAAITAESLYGKETLSNVKPLFNENQLADITSLDRIIIASRTADNEEATALIKQLKSSGAIIVVLSSVMQQQAPLKELADFFIDTKVTQGLVPQDDGTRTGFPATLSTLYAYHALLLTTNEILLEHE